METNYNYTDAYNELQQIVSEIELGDINVDDLASKIKRASQLIIICKAKLTATEEEVQNLLQQLNDEDQDIIEPTDLEEDINEE